MSYSPENRTGVLRSLESELAASSFPGHLRDTAYNILSSILTYVPVPTAMNVSTAADGAECVVMAFGGPVPGESAEATGAGATPAQNAGPPMLSVALQPSKDSPDNVFAVVDNGLSSSKRVWLARENERQIAAIGPDVRDALTDALHQFGNAPTLSIIGKVVGEMRKVSADAEWSIARFEAPKTSDVAATFFPVIHAEIDEQQFDFRLDWNRDSGNLTVTPLDSLSGEQLRNEHGQTISATGSIAEIEDIVDAATTAAVAVAEAQNSLGE